MKQIAFTFIIVLAALTLVLSAVQMVRIQRPAMPMQWSQLQRGMTPEQVRSVVADEVYDLRAAQKFDLVVHKNKYGHWQLTIRYDSAGKLESATASYIHSFGNGLLNSSGKKVL